jgi:hypothetical protein
MNNPLPLPLPPFPTSAVPFWAENTGGRLAAFVTLRVERFLNPFRALRIRRELSLSGMIDRCGIRESAAFIRKGPFFVTSWRNFWIRIGHAMIERTSDSLKFTAKVLLLLRRSTIRKGHTNINNNNNNSNNKQRYDNANN